MTALVQIAAVAMAPDASWAVTVAADGTVRTWGADVTPRVIRWAVPIQDGQPAAVALSGDRVRVLWATGETIRLYENVKGAYPREDAFLASASVQALALSPSGARAVVACDDATLRILNVGTGDFGRPVTTEGLTVHAVAVASDLGPVVAAFADGSVRRYDLAAGEWETVGSGPGINLVAVSPDGGTVIAVGADSTLVRWNRPGGAPPDYRVLDTAATAIAIDRTGGRVLAGRADGSLWRHDMTGVPAVEFTAPASAARPTQSSPAPPWWESSRQDAPPPPTSASAEAEAAPARVPPWASPGLSVVDEDVRFTVYRPQTLSPGVWGSLLVFAHKTDLIEEPGGPPVDPTEQVEAIARAHFGNVPVRKAEEDARSGVSRGARLRITADLPGIWCNPASAEFDWWEPVHHVVFRLLAAPEMVGSVVRGAVRIWCGPLILGEVSVAISVTASAPAAQPPAVAESAPRYRKIFPSYSHQDRAVVDGFEAVVHAFGDQYLRDVIAPRSGEEWRERLLELIEEADIFQLFWSSNSMRSPYCQKEWEHALALGRPFFVRPFYWEDPRPEDPASGLPPVALNALEFAKVTFLAGQAEIPTLRGTQPGAAFPAPAGYVGSAGAAAEYIDAPQAQDFWYDGGADTGGQPAWQPPPAAPASDPTPPDAYTTLGPPASYGQGNVPVTDAYGEGWSAPGPGYPQPSAPGQGYPPSGPAAGPPWPPAPTASPSRSVARRGRLVLAALVLVVIVVAVIIAFSLR
jgi:hypothetical protein